MDSSPLLSSDPERETLTRDETFRDDQSSHCCHYLDEDFTTWEVTDIFEPKMDFGFCFVSPAAAVHETKFVLHTSTSIDANMHQSIIIIIIIIN